MNTDQLKTYAIRIANVTLKYGKVLWDISWAMLIVLWDWTWRITKWAGRTTLWVFFLPLGIYRSYLHHSRKREQERLQYEYEKNRMV